jgi:hypothetical protein
MHTDIPLEVRLFRKLMLAFRATFPHNFFIGWATLRRD